MNFSDGKGGMHGSQMKAYEASKKPDMSSPNQQATDAPKDIESDPPAMECVDKLKQMGYTADDVAKAMGDDMGGEQQGGQAATQAAPMQIPGV